jgi:hypothetical protein
MYDMAIKYYLHIDPSQMSDEEWAREIALLDEIRKKEKLNSL